MHVREIPEQVLRRQHAISGLNIPVYHRHDCAVAGIEYVRIIRARKTQPGGEVDGRLNGAHFPLEQPIEDIGRRLPGQNLGELAVVEW